MTTKELKAYIDRTLGNSVRCLLPSYWWKRLFGVVLDRVDEVSIKKVGSVSELKALGLEEGSIASVVGETHSFSECYLITEDVSYEEVLHLLTPIKSIEMVGANPQVEIAMFLVDVVTGTVVYIIASPEENLVGAIILEAETETSIILAMNGSIVSSGVTQLNNMLSSGNFVFAMASIEEEMNTPIVFHFVDQIIKWGSGTSAYLKDKKEWVRLLKDGENTIPQTIIDLINDKQDVLVSGENIKTINGQDILGSGDITISGGGDIDTSNFATKQELATKQDTISDLSTIRSNAEKGASAVQPSSLAKVATSGSYNDLSNKPTIPSAVTESTVSGWGFTKNTGTYSKPSSGIPKTDLASAVQTSLGKADTALQSYTEKYTGTITGIKMNGASKGTSGVVDLGTVITSHQDISGKQDKITDLETIRSGAAKGATAIQEVKTINGESIVGSGNIEIKAGTDIDVSTLATKTDLENLTNEVIDNEEVLSAALNDINDKVIILKSRVDNEAATKEELYSIASSINQTILSNEEIIAAALNDINLRLSLIEQYINSLKSE